MGWTGTPVTFMLATNKKDLIVNRLRRLSAYSVVLTLLLPLQGCQTYGEGVGLGAAIGTGLGTAIGSNSGEAFAGALIRAGFGAASGAVAHDIKAKRELNGVRTAEVYEYVPEQGEVMTFEEASVSPAAVVPGGMLKASLQYALLGTGSSVRATETRQLQQDDKIIAKLSSKTVTRADGTWLSTQQFKLPTNLASGRYTRVQRVTKNQSTISGTSQFTIH